MQHIKSLLTKEVGPAIHFKEPVVCKFFLIDVDFFSLFRYYILE